MHDDYLWLTAWLRSMRARNLSQGTLAAYRQTVTQLLIWTHDRDKTLTTLTHRDITEWMGTCRIQARASYAYLSRVSTFYTWLIREEHVEVDPTKRLDRPKLDQRLPRPAETSPLRDAIAIAEPRVAAMLGLGAFVGMRRFEIAGLRVENLFLRRRPATVLIHGKGSKDRVNPVHDDAIALLHAHELPTSGFVFPGRDPARPITPGRAGLLMADVLSEAAGQRVTPHQLRHWFATELYAICGDILLVQQMMGHSSVATTQIYTKLVNPHADQMIARLSLAEPQPEAEIA